MELGPLASLAAGAAIAASILALRLALGLAIGQTYPYAAFILGVALAGIVGGLAGAAAAGLVLVGLGHLLFGAGFEADVPGLSLAFHLGGAAVVVGAIVILRRCALQVRRERAVAASALHELATAQEHSRRFVDLTPHIAWTADPEGRITLLPKKMATLTGAPVEELMGRGWQALVHPDDLGRVRAAWEKALATGEPYVVEFRGMRADGNYVWMSSQAYAARNERGEVTGWYGLSENIDSRKEAEKDRELLLREVDHRARNLLTVLQGMVTLMPKEDPKAFAASFRARINAMAGAHALLAESRWRGVQLRTLLEEELQPYGLERMHLLGEAWVVHPDRVQHLSMIFHELATNSAKYGSLSVPDGRLRVEWRMVDHRHIMVEWAESGGPRVVAPPDRQGFGSTLIRSLAGRRSGESVMYDWRPEGLCCAIVLADLVADGEPVT